MKICLQSDQYSMTLSGIGVHTKNLVDGLLDEGHEVVLICNEKGRPEKRKGFTYEYVPSWSWDPNHARWFSFAINTSKRIRDIHRRHGFEIFHSLDAREGSLAAKKLDIPTLGSINDYYFAIAEKNPLAFYREYKADWLRRYLNYNFIHFYEKWTLNNLDMIIANSNVTLAEIRRCYKIDSRKMIMLHKAISYFPKKRNRAVSREKGDYRILTVGSGLQRKGIFYLIRAAPRVLEKFPESRFIIVGKKHKRIVQECEKYGVLDAFDFRGILRPEETRKHYRESDIFILPSIIEGFGVSIVEAMSFGLPCIGSDVGGIKDILNGVNGIRVRPRDEKAIGSAIIELLGDPKKRERVSRAAFADSKKYNAKDQVKNTLKVYKKLL
jgi:glycosyltransferase involved in cell wall biosynthesis